MTSAILIPWPKTNWQLAGRMASSTPVEINDEGKSQIATWAELIEHHQPSVIHFADISPARETAEQLAAQTHARAKKSQDLAEVNLGLWEGMTPEELKKRFSKIYKQWNENPMNVCPPDGEEMPHASERLMSRIEKLAHKHEEGCFAVVLGPLAFALVRCHLEEREMSEIWRMPNDKPFKYFINLEENKAILTN